MENFHDTNLSYVISAHAVSNPVFSTNIISTASGKEVRHMNRDYYINQYTISHCHLTQNEFDEFHSFFRARCGSFFSFRLRDFADFSVKNQFLAKGNGEKQEFEIYKMYSDKHINYLRRILKPVKDSVFVKINETPINPTIDYNQGVIKFYESPKVEEIITIDFKFDVPVRFANDTFDYKPLNDGSVIITDLKMIEVR